MNKTPENIAQLIIAALVVLGGLVLLHVGIQIDPAWGDPRIPANRIW